MRRWIAPALVVLFAGLSAAPVLAGPAETAYLQRLSASWTGHGRLSGAQSGSVTCRIDFTAGGQSTRYQGRCTVPDAAAQAFNGAISYDDASHHYISRSAGGTVVGTRHGDTLTFTNKTDSMMGRTYSTMRISPSSLVVDFSIVDQNGEKTASTITFSH